MSTAYAVKRIRKYGIFALCLAPVAYFVPVLAGVLAVTGLIDVMRNEKKSVVLFDRYFTGNGIFTWLLSPLNLAADLLCYRNRRIFTLADFPPAERREIEGVLAIFQERRAEIMAQIDRAFPSGRRSMYVYQWFGRKQNTDVPEFCRDYRYIRTIAVSVFAGREATSFHFGSLRLSLRVLYNLSPVESDQVYIECGRTRHYWHQNPLFIFDDTLMHRSVNYSDRRRYCAFVDVMRPSPVPGVLSVALTVASTMGAVVKNVFYRNWRML